MNRENEIILDVQNLKKIFPDPWRSDHKNSRTCQSCRWNFFQTETW